MNPQQELFQHFISEKKVLIVDPGVVTRSNVAKVLTSMGLKSTDLILADNYETAEKEIERSRPRIVISDYDLGKRCGLDLFQKVRAQNSEAANSKNVLLVLLTSNTSQSAVAKAAEEDVDGYILKPYSPNIFKSALIKSVVAKAAPSGYVRTLENGRQLMLEGKLDDAAKTFEEAEKLDRSPSLACYYLGQVEQLKKKPIEAETRYLSGLSFNKIHYKCLVGDYDLLMEKGSFAEAYEVIKRICRYYPANPQRLTSVLRLAIINKKYDDVEKYYQIFSKLDDRNEEVSKFICAALVVCGKYYLQTKTVSRATELFEKASLTGKRRPKVLRQIIQALVEAGLTQKAREFLAKFTSDALKTQDYFAMQLLVLDQIENQSFTIKRGNDLLAAGIHDPVIYQIVIKRSIEAGLVSQVEDLKKAAAQRWPDRKDLFEGGPNDPKRAAS